MDFNSILTSLRHPTLIQFFIGAYVKTQQSPSFNPNLQADTRPVRVITGFITISGQPAASTVLDSPTDSSATLASEDILLSELELFTTYQKPTPAYAYYAEAYWLILGREHSLLKALKMTDYNYNIGMELISESVCEPVTKNDMETIVGINLRTLLVPLNLSIKPIVAMEIVAQATTVSKSAMPNMTIIAKLTPIDTTENHVEWIISSTDQTLITLAPNTDTRICTLTFNEVGICTITAKSVENTDITASITFTIEA